MAGWHGRLAAGSLAGRRLKKMTPVKKLESDGNFNYIVVLCSHSAKIKLHYIKNIFHVAHFHINLVLSTRNMFKEVNVIKSRGALGTGFTYAPVLLFELYLAISNRAVNRQPSFRTEDS